MCMNNKINSKCWLGFHILSSYLDGRNTNGKKLSIYTLGISVMSYLCIIIVLLELTMHDNCFFLSCFSLKSGPFILSHLISMIFTISESVPP